ncbi:MAG: hypothetical protein ICV62_12595 [Cyanobacteria bacterium Co-bin13]|nr:hypothetical protein [Cyanobacteria bacterium Co-bin13]
MVSRFTSGLGLAVVLASLLGAPLPLQAQNCTANCRSDEIQFTPGERLQVEFVNQSSRVVTVEQVPLIGPRTLRPGQTTNIGFNWGTTPNIAIRFWSEAEQPIRAYLFRPADRTLRVEIRDLPWQLSDRSIYIQNDGRVIIY